MMGLLWRLGVAFTVALLALACAPAEAALLSIGFTGMITQVDDPAGIFDGLPVPSGMVGGVFTLDPEEGTISFGDGTTGQSPPTGTGNIGGTYRYGSGASGNVPPPTIILFHDCFEGSILAFTCVPGQGGNAYVVEFPDFLSDDFVQSFVILLGGGTSVDGGDVLPPPLDSFATAEFLWLFSVGENVAAVTGSIDAMAPVPEPAAFVLFGTALAGLGAMRRRKRKTAAPVSRIFSLRSAPSGSRSLDDRP
jgi:PEP-CTERM motif